MGNPSGDGPPDRAGKEEPTPAPFEGIRRGEVVRTAAGATVEAVAAADKRRWLPAAGGRRRRWVVQGTGVLDGVRKG